MTEVATKTHLAVSADQVWGVIGDFHTLPDWHPLVNKSESADGGMVRKLTLPDGSGITEKLEHTDDNERTYSYGIMAGPLPVSNYRATIRVVPDDDGAGCTVEWSSEFEAVGSETDAMAAIRGVFDAGLENLKKMFPG